MSAGYGIENGFSAGASLLGSNTGNRPTAVFAANDNLAMGIIAAAHRFHVTVGDDLALVGYNDTPLASRLSTPLSSVRVPLDQIAGNAIDLIVNPDKEPKIRKSMPTLIPRESSGSPRYSAPQVS
jgi:LacI family transcriptional regulator